MKQFGLRKPISQLFTPLNGQFFLHVSCFQIGCSEQSNKTYNVWKNQFCDVITLELYY